MLNATKSVLLASIAALGLAAQANAATTFTVDSTKSSLNVDVTASTSTIFGTIKDSGSDFASLVGNISAEIGSVGYTLNQIHVTDLSLSTSRGLSITLFKVMTGSTTVLTLSMNSSAAGSPTTIGSDGSFTQNNNAITTAGDMTFSGTTQSLAGTYTSNFTGILTDTGVVSGSGHVMQLTIPNISITQTQTTSGVDITMLVTGNLVATGVFTPVPEIASLSILAAAPLMMLRRSRKM